MGKLSKEQEDELIRDIIKPPREIRFPGYGTPVWLDVLSIICIPIMILFVVLFSVLG